MKFSRWSLCGTLIPLLLIPTAVPAAPLGVTCSVTATPLNFGNYAPASFTPLNSVGSISATCSSVTVLLQTIPLTISLSAGSSASFTLRQLRSGIDSLSYNLYSDSSYTAVLGDGTGNTQRLSAGLQPTLASSVTKSFPVYGRIPPAQNVSPGNYADTVIVTVTY